MTSDVELMCEHGNPMVRRSGAWWCRDVLARDLPWVAVEPCTPQQPTVETAESRLKREKRDRAKDVKHLLDRLKRLRELCPPEVLAVFDGDPSTTSQLPVETEIVDGDEAEPQYEDMDGNTVSLDKLCRLEPAWAANQIRQRDAAIAKAVRAKRERPCAWCMDECPNCGARPRDEGK
jgi:hypothetical protein